MARDVAARAGQLLVDIREQAGPIAPDDKAGLKALRDRADSESNDLITAALTLADGDALLSEEGVDDENRLSAQRVWIVDPLDGTWEYGQGRSDFGVHIALWDMARKEMLLGVVDLPAQGLVRTSGDVDPELPMLPGDRPLRIVASRTRPRLIWRASARACRKGSARRSRS